MNMQQKELFPDNKIFSHNVMVFWLVGLTVSFLLFALIYLVGFLISPGGSNVSETQIMDLKNQIKNLDGKITVLEEKVASGQADDPKPNDEAASKNEEKNEQENSAPAIEVDTSSWESYESTNYKFSLKHAANWTKSLQGSSIPSVVIEDGNASMVAFTSPSNSRLAIYPEGEFDHDFDLPESTMKITIDGKSATRSNYKNGLVAIFFDDLNDFRIEYSQAHSDDKDIFEAILQSLDFK